MIFVAGQHWFKQQHPLECTRLIQKTATLRTRLAALPVLFRVDLRFPLPPQIADLEVEIGFPLKSLESSPNYAPSAHLNYVIVIG
jgi:hypothetical protein